MSNWLEMLAEHRWIRPWQHVATFLIAFALIVSRRPDALFHAQFWAEDGRIYFQDAYNLGWWKSLFQPYAGYFITFPRISASLALLVPFSKAPLVLNAIGIAVQSLPANLLLSSRSSTWGSLRYRMLLAGVYLALPNSGELSANISNCPPLLALSAFILLVANTPRTNVGRLFDAFFLVLFGLTGPYCFFLMPVTLFLGWRHQDRWRWVLAAVVTATCAVQAWSLLILDPSGRVHYPVGARMEWFTRILASQVYLGTLIGSNALGAIAGPRLFVVLACVAIFGTALVVVIAARSNERMRLLLLLSCLVFAAALASPMILPQPGFTPWQLLAGTGGCHYWFFPTLAFAWSLVWCVISRQRALMAVGSCLLVFMSIGIVRDWRELAMQDMGFAAYAKEFDAASPGAEVDIPINPKGWTMHLVKR